MCWFHINMLLLQWDPKEHVDGGMYNAKIRFASRMCIFSFFAIHACLVVVSVGTLPAGTKLVIKQTDACEDTRKECLHLSLRYRILSPAALIALSILRAYGGFEKHVDGLQQSCLVYLTKSCARS